METGFSNLSKCTKLLPGGCLKLHAVEEYNCCIALVSRCQVMDRTGVDLNRSGTRKEELLLGEDALDRIWILRRLLHPLSPEEGMQLLIRRLGQTASNAEFLTSLKAATT